MNVGQRELDRVPLLRDKKKNPWGAEGRKGRVWSEAPLSNPSGITGGVGRVLPGGAEIKSTFTLLKIRKHPSVCAAEQQGGF